MQSAWKRAMGMSGYRGSPAEREDRAEGIEVGGKVRWLVTGPLLVGTITEVEIDENGDPWFHLKFDDHKDVRVERREILKLQHAKDLAFHTGDMKTLGRLNRMR